MFGWKSRDQRKLARGDENELRRLEELAQQYRDEKYDVTYEYVMRCYREYMEDTHKRTRSPIIDRRLITVLDDLKEGNDRRDVAYLDLSWELACLKNPLPF
jgi:hypothetical protein